MKTNSRKFGSIAVATPFVAPGARIGIMGGSFNPPHGGHLIVARTALRRLGLDQLWWVVTPGNPLKKNDGLPSQHARMAACRKLAGSDPRMKITGFEAALGSPYTAVTLAFLRQRYARARFVWVMGADNLAGFHRWQDWRDIADAMPIAVIDRPQWRLKGLAAQAAHALAQHRRPESEAKTIYRRDPPVWVYITSKLSDLSSTRLRAAPEIAKDNKQISPRV